MGYLKNIWNGEYRSFVRFAVYATAFFLVYVGLLRQNNLFRWAKAEIEIKRQQRQIERYERSIKEMDRQIDRLSNDKESLEEFARENFHLASPGDDVYIVE